ncbi:hypothetical protein B0H14DRAFT_2685122 [Mycena olivaceomarginata]|nr:hypothetical protein B0H14DRAFT_2685122 [Mycena olivaceomarginata]
MISDPFSSLPISNSLIASTSASDGDTSTSGGGGGDQPAWANDSASSSVTLKSGVVTLSSASSTVSQSTFTSTSSGVAVIIPVQVSTTITAQVSSTIPAGSTMPTGSTSTTSTPSHNSRAGAIAGGIVGSISVLLLLGVTLWFFHRRARKQAERMTGLADGVVGAKEDDGVGGKLAGSIDGELVTPFMAGVGAATYAADPAHQQQHQYYADPQGQGQQAYYGNGAGAHETGTSEGALSTVTGSYYPHSGTPPAPTADTSGASSSRGYPNPMTAQEREARGVGLAVASPPPNSNVPAVPQNEIATPILPTTSDSTASWKYYIGALPEMPLLSSKIVFAVDASDSTAGQVMQRQEEFVLAMVEDHQLPHSVIMWGSSVEQPKSVRQISWNRPRNWGTSPEVIFDDAAITEELKSCNMWYLLTDGEVDRPVNFARKALENGMANTSASGEIYVVAAKGAFEVLTAGYKINLANLNWKSLPFFPTESAFKNALEGINIVDTARLKTGGAVYLGRAWHEKHQCFVRIDRLLEQMPPQSILENELLDLLEDETFKALALSCKTRGLVQNLRDWLLAKYEQPRDMPAIHRPHLENSPLLPRISRCLEKVTALENTGFDVGILDSPKVDQEPEVLKAHSSTSTTGAQYVSNTRATRTSTVVESSASLTQHSSYATTYTSNAHWSS